MPTVAYPDLEEVGVVGTPLPKALPARGDHPRGVRVGMHVRKARALSGGDPLQPCNNVVQVLAVSSRLVPPAASVGAALLHGDGDRDERGDPRNSGRDDDEQDVAEDEREADDAEAADER